jgi:hypothetical protein
VITVLVQELTTSTRRGGIDLNETDQVYDDEPAVQKIDAGLLIYIIDPVQLGFNRLFPQFKGSVTKGISSVRISYGQRDSTNWSNLNTLYRYSRRTLMAQMI